MPQYIRNYRNFMEITVRLAGIINENFVYLDLKRRTGHPSEIALETPAFATLGAGEIDFYAKAVKSQKTYAIEVKAGKNAGNTITIPIYGISRFQF